MKIRRYKKVNRNIGFYMNNFMFRKPYQLLVDGTFCYAALNNQVNIADNIPRYLQSELKLLTTQCVIIETENLGQQLSGALIILKQYAVHKCGHEGKPIAASKCLLSMLGRRNEKHYIVATQDRDLQDKVRKIPGVPLLYLFQRAPVLDEPSAASKQAIGQDFESKFQHEKERIRKLKEKSGILVEENIQFKRKKKKGPNPLSCKKKKKTKQQQPVMKAKNDTKNETEKIKRKKLRIPEHIKEVLLSKKSS